MRGSDTGHASWDYAAAADLQRDFLIDDTFLGSAKCHVPVLRRGHVGKFRRYAPSSGGIATLDGGSTKPRPLVQLLLKVRKILSERLNDL